MSIEPIIDGVLAGQISAKASVCILSELEDSDIVPTDESRWGPLSRLANLHWMATMSIPEEKLTFLKSLDGQRMPSGANGSDTSPLRDEERRTKAECKPLLALATPEMFKGNAFRITGLSVDATAREIARHADKLKMLEELGHGASAHTGAFALTPPPTVDQIRDAIQCLREPERRLLDEFFWFWPEQFGSSTQDPAIQALAGGDRETALEIWTLKETNPTTGVTAMHNIAVLWQLVALEWEEYAAQQQIDEERRLKIEGHWRASFKRWHLLAVDDLFWETISARIRQLDDARLTTGFARKMRATLPRALGKINAALALRCAESGRMSLAEIHVNFMRHLHQSADDINRTAELVLTPTIARLKQQLDRAQQRAATNVTDALPAARELLDHTRRSLVLLELFFGKHGEVRDDLLDQVVTLCNRLQLAYHKATNDNKGCLDLLNAALPLATLAELRQQIEKNIATLNGNIAYARLEPVLTVLRSIQESTAFPKVKLGRVKQEIIAKLAEMSRVEDFDTFTANEFADRIASALRAISIDAHNDHDDLITAVEAINSACDLARDSNLKERLIQDKVQITRNKNEAERHNLLLEIRGDAIEVTREKFRYNSQVIPASDINGIRFGVFTQYTNGVKSSVSYKVAVSSARHGTVDVECKRFFRNEQKAAADFQAIVNALYYQIVPPLVSRVSANIAGGSQIALGDCTMTDKGILMTKGVLLWKEDHLIPWADARFGSHAGRLNISSAQNPKVSKAFALRDTWNAVIFKEIANAVVTRLGKSAAN